MVSYVTVSHRKSIWRNGAISLGPRPPGEYEEVLRALGKVTRLLCELSTSGRVYLRETRLLHPHTKVFLYLVLHHHQLLLLLVLFGAYLKGHLIESLHKRALNRTTICEWDILYTYHCHTHYVKPTYTTDT